VHLRPRLRRLVTVRLPLRLDFLARHPVILALRPILAVHHIRNDGIRIKLGKMAVIPRSDGHEVALSVNGINVRTLIKTNVVVTLVRILLRKLIHYLTHNK